MEEYSLGLALFDFLPVLLAAVGFYLLVELLAKTLPESRTLLLAALALIIAGGLCKAIWKLIWVLAQVDLVVLDSLLFIYMAPGMVLLAMHTASAQHRWRGGTSAVHPARNSLLLIVPVLAAAGVAALQSEGRAWFFLLLAASSLANIVMTLLLLRQSWIWEQRLTAGLFLLSLLLTLSLSWLARFSAGSLPLQWLAESINLFAVGTFALASWRLRSHYWRRAAQPANTGPDSPVPTARDAPPKPGA